MTLETLEIIIKAILILGLCLGVGYRLLVFVKTTSYSWKRNREPIYEDTAKVLSKRSSYDTAGLGGWGDSGLVHYATFETQSGKLLELRMGRSVYGALQAGDVGRLVWQGKRLEQFEHT